MAYYKKLLSYQVKKKTSKTNSRDKNQNFITDSNEDPTLIFQQNIGRYPADLHNSDLYITLVSRKEVSRCFVAYLILNLTVFRNNYGFGRVCSC